MLTFRERLNFADALVVHGKIFAAVFDHEPEVVVKLTKENGLEVLRTSPRGVLLSWVPLEFRPA